MKAAYLVAPQTFEIREVLDPVAPEDGLVLAVKACGVCGSDLRRWKEGPAGGQPVVPGHEIAGVVTAVGARLNGFTVGDHLAVAPDVHCGECYYCEHGLYNLCDNLRMVGISPAYPGGFAEYLVLTAEILHNGIVHRMPSSLSFLNAALAEPLSSVLAAQEEAGVRLGDTVVVMGGGPIGCLHIAVAHARGARTILSEPSPVRRSMAARFNPALILDPLSQDVVAAVRAATGGRGAEVAVCANPVAATHTQAVELVRKRGKILLFGGLPKASPLTTLDANRIHYSELQVIGTFSYHPTSHGLALEVLECGLVPGDEVITHTFDLEGIGQAFATAAGGEALKVVVTG